MKLAAVTFDVGGVIYSDEVFKRAIYSALEHYGAEITSDRFNRIYDAHLKSQNGSLRNKLCMEFFGSLELKSKMMEYATERWKFTDADLYQDARDVIIEMKKRGLKIGLIANQPATVVETLKAHGIYEYIDFAGISSLIGIEKPSREIFELALEKLAVPADQSLHIGNRIDTDVIPAQSVGMRAVWIRRGEANPSPSVEDLKIPDLVVDSLIGLPELIEAL